MGMELRVIKYSVLLAALSGADFWEPGTCSSMKAEKHEWY